MFHRILVPLDSTPFAEAALGPAIAIAKACGADLDLVLVQHPPVPLPDITDVMANAQREVETEYVEGFMTRTAGELALQGIRVELIVRLGHPADVLLEQIAERAVDLVVMASHGRTGLARSVLGSVADRLMREAEAPVLMIREMRRPGLAWAGFRRILVPLDGSREAESVLDDAAVLAQVHGAVLSLVRMVAPMPVVGVAAPLPEIMLGSIHDEQATERMVASAEGYLAEIASRLHERGLIEIESTVHVASDPEAVIARLIRDYAADLVCIAPHGRGVSRFFLGSLTDAVLRETGCAVLMHRRRGMGTEADAGTGLGMAIPVTVA